jgi:hypothetical protein
MNEQVKTEWLEALESGEYPQGKLQLRQKREDDTYEYCCLGVLCDIAAKHGIGHWNGKDDIEGIIFVTNSNGFEDVTILPDAVRDWAGLDDNVPDVIFDQKKSHLAEVNDYKNQDFKAIANIIRTQL